MLKGKGIWMNVISQCDHGDMDVIRDKLLKMKADYVIVKAVNGYSGFNYIVGIDAVKALYTYLEPVGIQMAVFAAPYGDAFGVGNWSKEVDRIVRRMNVDLPMIKYLILDIEGRWKHANNSAGIASQFMERLLMRLRSDVVLGFSSYRYPSLHPKIPYSAFLSRCDINMPQVYWEGSHDPVKQLAVCMLEYAAMNYGPVDLEFIPAAPAYHRTDLDPPWLQEPKDMREFHAAVMDRDLQGETWWDYEHIRSTGLLPVIEEFVFEATPDPEEPDHPAVHIHDQYAYRQHDHVDINKRIKDQMDSINLLADQVIMEDKIEEMIQNKVDGIQQDHEDLFVRIQFLENALSFWKWLGRLLRIAPSDPE